MGTGLAAGVVGSGVASDAGFLRFLRSCDTATLSNAIEALEVRDRTEGYADLRLRKLVGPPDPMVGFAVTATIDSTGPDGEAGRLDRLFEAVRECPGPVVLVLQEVGPDPLRACHAGEIVATGARAGGCVGVVSDAGIRDLPAISSLGLHGFALGTVPSHGTFAVVDVGAPVEVAGLAIRPGDLLHGDGDGLLGVPTEAPDRLADKVGAVRERERRLLEKLRGTGPDEGGKE